MSGPLKAWERQIAEGRLERDPDQVPAITELERMYLELEARRRFEKSMQGRMARLLGKPRKPVRGVYLYGSVGRGKTMLMDIFFHSLTFRQKRRQHFHRFMASIHDRLKQLRNEENPLNIIADQLAEEIQVICFDEFAVNDIADAMILGNLFSALFERGVTLAATSNILPANLYQDGLQRQRFLPAIEAIENNSVVVELGGDKDYRLRALESASVFIASDEQANNRLNRAFDAIAPDSGEPAGEMTILGRPIEFRRLSDGVVWFDFGALCDGPRSQDDYIELAREFQTVIVSDVPRFTAELENQARRFIALIDEFYDRKVKLILSAGPPLDELYAGNKLTDIFERTRSRLVEMQSREYLALPHRP